jgi:anti-sigma regulatory factor (Ser/Thr protein kinase)
VPVVPELDAEAAEWQARARRFVEEELRPAGAGDDTLLHAQLLATELVTNAARHAESPVELSIARQNSRVRIEARDDSAAIPSAPRVDTPTRHRGVQLVQDLSRDWGVDPHDGGKVVWCELASRGLARRRA